ncbi:hypothetical protein [Actinomadura sediminis]|uniref:DUF2703 domain-containing protein n=1 Tax=Actinomadura sediminis TaxID=1038904 RepID=A0ABW3EMC9_9ACTN
MTVNYVADTEAVSIGTGSRVRLIVEYWTVAMEDQDSCGSCDATLALLHEAIDAVRPFAERLGIVIDVAASKITTWDDAVEQGIVASPTIRAEGLEMRPVHPDGSQARVWSWRGTVGASPAPEALLDLLLRAVAERSRRLGAYLAEGGPAPYVRTYLRATAAADTAPTATCGPVPCG